LGIAIEMVIEDYLFFCLEPMLDKDRKKEENNRLRD
jgi:hypothetical protein